jgi:hypothetical protein
MLCSAWLASATTADEELMSRLFVLVADGPAAAR